MKKRGLTRREFLKASTAAGIVAVGTGRLHHQGAVQAYPDQVGSWEGPVPTGVAAIHAAVLPTGKVLVSADGYPAVVITITPSWSLAEIQPEYETNLFCSGHAYLPDGRLMFVGGGNWADDTPIKDASLFDPFQLSFTQLPPMFEERWYPTCTTLADGRILVISGNKANGQVNCIPEVFDPITWSWQRLENADREVSGLIDYPFMFALSDPLVFMAGPMLDSGTEEEQRDTAILNISTETWFFVDRSPIRGGSAVMYSPGRIMKCCAETSDSSDGSGAETTVINMDDVVPTWRPTASMANQRVNQNLVVLPDGKVLVVGGFNTDPLVSDFVLAAEMWDPATETWSTMASMTIPRSYHSTAVLLPDARVLMAGQYAVDPADDFLGEIYSPPYLFRGARPRIAASPTVVNYGTPFAVASPDAATVVGASMIGLPATTHAVDMGQRYVPLTVSIVETTVTVDAPANAGIAPPGYHMLFLLNQDDVPSKARVVRLA